jgi:phospholipase/carboxylesterase
MPGPAEESVLMLGAPLAAARAVCVLVHGRGQTPEDMVQQIARPVALDDIAWMLPHAPGKSWYKARAVDALTDETRAELDASMARVRADMDAMVAAGRPLVLAGFSQGACLSIELVLRGRVTPRALVAFTGCRVGTPGCDRPSRPLDGLPVLLTGSDGDPWIPAAAFGDAAAELTQAGARLRAESFPGRPHEVSAPEIVLLRDMLAGVPR